MKNYRKLNRQETKDINEASCIEELGSILAKYDLQVYRRLCIYEDDTCYEYYLADCSQKELAKQLGFSKHIIDGQVNYEGHLDWLLKRIVA